MQAQKKYEEQNSKGLANLRPEREELHLEQQVRLLLKDPNTDRFLFVQEQKADGTLSNHIKTVGGIRKPQETLEDAIHREVEEEVGLNIKPQSLHPLTVFTDRREKEVGGTLRVTSSTVHFYYGTLVEDKFPPEGPVTTNVREDEQGNKTAFFHYLSSAEIQHAQSKKGLKIFEATNKAVRYFLDKSYVIIERITHQLSQADIDQIYERTGIPLSRDVTFYLRGKNTSARGITVLKNRSSLKPQSLYPRATNILMVGDMMWYEKSLTDENTTFKKELFDKRYRMGKAFASSLVEGLILLYRAE